MNTVLSFPSLSLSDLADVGGKNASLGEMISSLKPLGVNVPSGFATTAEAYRLFLTDNALADKIYACLNALDINDVDALRRDSQTIREWIQKAPLPEMLINDVIAACEAHGFNNNDITVAVRSSATAEDLPQASFAGQQETFLNVKGIDDILQAIKGVYASLFTERSISYRVHQGFAHDLVAISAGVQLMVRSDLAASGVIFTLDTESGFDQVVFVTAAYGLGETVVQGMVNPDEFYVHKPTLLKNKSAIVSRKCGNKAIKMVYDDANEARVKTVDVDGVARQHFCVTDEEVLLLAKQALTIEKHYAKPMDIEWAKDGVTGELFIVQARPETVQSHASRKTLERYHLPEHKEALVQGKSVGQKIGKGIAKHIDNPTQMARLNEGDVLIADMTDPDWEPIMKRASAIVTNRGGRTCHAAIVAREMGIPAVVGCGDATERVLDGSEVTVSCVEGETGSVYPGLLEYTIKKNDIDALPALPVRMYMNLGNPELAFSRQFLPNDGVGLARLEFIIDKMIGIHPNAVLTPEVLSDSVRDEMAYRTAAYKTPVEFYIEKLAEGIATIAAAFYPKPVIVRFSDFKSNEYANLLGGEFFEPKEDNPMLGYRGASRYLSGSFKSCFALECEAIKRVREQKGLENTHVMFPFVRTVNEAKQLIALVEGYGLKRGDAGLAFYMMCEIPSNVILAEQFLLYFDGFSIGSNDLTQLTLGLDRDSELVADLFDERDEAIKTLLSQVIRAAHKANKYVGICGQGPSDHVDFAKWLVSENITSLSLSPDALLPTWLALGH